MSFLRNAALSLAILMCALSASAEVVPTDTFSLNFQAIKFEYIEQKPDSAASLLVLKTLRFKAPDDSGGTKAEDDDVLFDPADDLLPPPKPVDDTLEPVILSCCTAA